MDATVRDLVTLLRNATQRHASRPVFAYPGRDGTWVHMLYADLAREEVRLRAALARLGVQRGDRVAVISRNRPEWLVVLAAVHALGAVLVPMYEVQHESDWRHILRDAGARACFVSTEAIGAKVRAMQGELSSLVHVIGFEREVEDDTSFRHLVATAHPGDAPSVTPDPGDVCCFIYTSGTTGNPKGVELTHGAFAYEARVLRTQWNVGPTDRTVSILPWAHVGGFCELIFGVEQGVCIGLPPSFDQLGEALREIRPTLLAAVPRVWNGLYDKIHKGLADRPPALRWVFETAILAEKKRRGGKPLGKRERLARRVARKVLFPKIRGALGGELRFAISGAAALSKDVAEFFECLGIPVYEVYGQTEGCAVSTVNLPGASKLGTVGKALPGMRIEIDRSAGDADDGSGEVVIHSPSAMVGYHKLPDETAAVLRADGGIRTGDLGRVDDDGYLVITGRVREVYKLENGKFVTPVPIEESLGLSPLIAQAFVWGLNKPHNIALLVVDEESLKKWCAANGVAGETAALLESPRVRALYEREIAERTSAFKGYERVKGFTLISEAFTTESGMLTPTLKLKRGAVLARHKERIEVLYRA